MHMRLLHDFPKAINVVLVTFAVLLGCRTNRVSQKEKMGKKPYYEYNGQPTDKIESINPNTITLLTQIFPKLAVKKYGAKAADGAVLIESRAYARTKFESLFSSFSKDYAKIIASTDTSDIQYILNGKMLTGNFEGYLSRIDRQSLKKD